MTLDRTISSAPDLRQDLPEPHFDAETGGYQDTSSLVDDVSALFSDGKSYAKAELAFQKSRASYVADRSKGASVFGLGALIALHLALIALTVGLLLGLTEELGPWLATLIVFGLFAIIAGIMAMMLKSRLSEISSAMSDKNA